MKAKSTIRKTMQRLYREAKGNGSQERCRMAYDMATALQWIVEDTSWNPVSLLTACTNEGDENDSGKG